MHKGYKIGYDKVIAKGSLDALYKAGGDWYIVDLTNSYFRSKGVRVVRVLSSEMVPIWFGQKQLPLSKERITKVASMFEQLKIDHKPHLHPFLHPMG